MRCFFSRKKKPNEPPKPRKRKNFEGTPIQKHDHIVRLGLTVHIDQEPDLRILLESQHWPFKESEHPTTEPNRNHVRYTTMIPIKGASMNATGEAVSKLQYACRKAGVTVSVRSTARPQPGDTPTRRYRVVPVAPEPRTRLEALYQRAALRWRSPGYVQARSLKDAKTALPDYLAEHPGVGNQGELTVIGKKGNPEEPRQARLHGLGELLILIAAGTVAALSLALFLTALLPTGGSARTGIALITALLCSLGVWLLFRRLPEGYLHVWLPVIATSLIPLLALAAGYLDIHTYMWQFGITPGDISIPGYNIALASMSSVFPILGATIAVLGIFGFGHHFHLGGRGHLRYLNWLLAASVVVLYVATTAQVLIERSSTAGARDVARYQAQGGTPSDHAGIKPTPVCVEPASTAEDRFGPALPANRPVLHFSGVNKTDVLWDTENGVTKVPNFSVTLTPVPDLDSSCPVTYSTDEPAED